VRRITKWLFAIILASITLSVAAEAEASHFRYGNLTWRLPDPVGDPLTVEFTVTNGWRGDGGGPAAQNSQVEFGDGNVGPNQEGPIVGTGTDGSGQPYWIRQYTIEHTYASQGTYTAFVESGNRIAALINASDDDFRYEATVDLDGGSNTSGPISGIPVIIQMEVGSVNQFILPVFDPDADPHTCRFSTQAESLISGDNPPQLPGGDTLSFVMPGCSIEWDGSVGASVGDKYAVSIAVESDHNGAAAGGVSKTTVDYIIEWVPAGSKPTCTGGGNFIAPLNQLFSHQLQGTDPTSGSLLTLMANNMPTGSILTPSSGTTQAEPFSSTFTWTPVSGQEGQTYLMQFTYTDPTNISDSCTLIIEVPECTDFGDPCTVGVGGCQGSGTIVCQGANNVCNAVASLPQPETCNGIDDDCDSVPDNNLTDTGANCSSGEPGVCDAGLTECNSGNLDCTPIIAPGSQVETCNGDDDDCDGPVDEGFDLGSSCTVGVGACENTGVLQCDGSGGTECSVSPLPPGSAEICANNVDEDCDGTINDLDDCPDTDGDGIVDEVEILIGSDPLDQDSDDDGVIDGDEPGSTGCVDYPACFEDTDGDGLINVLDPDSDNDGLLDGTEMGLDCSNGDTDLSAGNCIPDGDSGSTTTDPLDSDTDNGGVSDGSEDSNLNGVVDAGETDPVAGQGADDSNANNTDTDGDGLSDNLEIFIGTDPNDQDSDDDGVIDSLEPNPSLDTDGDGLINALDPDSDNDGLYDGTEMGLDCSNADTDPGPPSHCTPDGDGGTTTTSPLNPDTDGGGVSDGSEDSNLNGVVDSGETDPTAGNGADDATVTDSDGDGLSDDLETTLGSNPNDADTDDDGVLDGDEANPADDTDGDGLINLLDPDSDNDGLTDGTEVGSDCTHADTNISVGNCTADGDSGATTTSMVMGDTDGGGVSDGSEDSNLDGVVDSGEGDPNEPADDSNIVDTDGDGLSDDLETTLGSDPTDADTDDDGTLDGDEPNPSLDSDGDGLINVVDVDSDNDGLYDGTEMGFDCSHPDTDPGPPSHCIADDDGGATVTSPLKWDTDDGGVSDGSEDWNLNGVVDSGETDPTAGNGADDSDAANLDTDGDGLSDNLENTIGSNPNDADSDDDGLLDGDEPNPADDADGDGDNNIADPDADGDGLFDGTENGLDCSHADTDTTAGNCTPDGDSGATTTHHLIADTDGGGVSDGDEDINKDGVVDQNETDPNDPADDGTKCSDDDDCPTGQVCNDMGECVPGCKDDDDCDPDEFCDPGDGVTIGECLPDEDGTGGSGGTGGTGGAGGAGGAGGGNNNDATGPIYAQGGCGCHYPAGGDETPWLLLMAGLGVVVGRRRRKSRLAA